MKKKPRRPQEKKPVITLPRDVFYTLQLMSLDLDGIGGMRFYDGTGNPYCYVGFLQDMLDMNLSHPLYHRLRGINPRGLNSTGPIVDTVDNDMAVARINKRRGVVPHARVPFKDWCKELNVVPDDR